MARLLRFVAAVTLGGIATAGLVSCSDAGEGEASASPSVVTSEAPSPSPSPSPSATLTPEEELLAQIPEEARHEDYPGAVAFARFFLKSWEEMYASLDTALVAALSSDTCTFCEQSMDEVIDIRTQGQRILGGGVSFEATPDRGGLEDDGNTNVTLDMTVAASTIVNEAGDAVREYPEEKLTTAVVLEYVEDHWQVVDVGSESR